MGGIKSEDLNSLSKDIWNWCCDRSIVGLLHNFASCKNTFESSINSTLSLKTLDSIISAGLHFPGICAADSQIFLSQHQFQISLDNEFKSSDLIPWKPDPDAVVIDAFSIPWSNEYYYMFPPFSLITRCVQNIINDQSECLIILPLWPTQIWLMYVAYCFCVLLRQDASMMLVAFLVIPSLS
jgi:hypothetical protein